MSSLYPQSPTGVSSQLTTPGKSFKKRIWIAVSALVLFMATYLGLSSWFLYKSYRLFANVFSGGKDGFWSFVGACLLGFLGIFMLKALFGKSKTENEDSLEITPEEEPELFDFINKIADEAKAPRPHKIFISNTVNACVFYDISIINFIFPTKKNLEIGLGLVNTLNLGEFKSIIAHEFGHFTQKSMLIGRWVYVAHRVANQIVAKRDAFDKFLNGLSRVDIRIAWIGWILSIIVWAIRSISDSLFTLVLYTQRALSREMEFHADLVAVSLTGSDAIVNSLYKLQAADHAYDKAIEFVNKQLRANKKVTDIYAIQSNAIKHMAVVLNNPTYGLSPIPDPDTDWSQFRVFKQQIALAPRMWSTHPSNIDREKNAKATYIKSEVDERSPWLLFKNPEELKSRTTGVLYRNVSSGTTAISLEESMSLHDADFQRNFLSPKYKGVYLNRLTLIDYKNVEELYQPPLDERQLLAQFAQLYPDSLQDRLNALKNLEEEILLLEGIHNKIVSANGDQIYYKDQAISHKELPDAIEQAKAEAKTIRLQIDEHTRLCRNVHYSAAKKIGNGWDDYLCETTKLIHYCEHAKKNLESYSKYFYKILEYTVQSRTINLTGDNLSPILNAASGLYSTLDDILTKGAKIQLSQPIMDKMDGKKWEEQLEPFQLGYAGESNINSWISAVGSWINLCLNRLQTLHEAALDELLHSEEYVKQVYTSSGGETAMQAPQAPVMIADYKRYDPHRNDTSHLKPDFFSNLFNGDGIGHRLARVAAAASIILFAIFLSAGLGKNSVIIYNGLPIDVNVHLGDKTVLVPHSEGSQEVSLNNESKLAIVTTTLAGDTIESFMAEIDNGSGNYIYNVANAAVLYTYDVKYSSIQFNLNSDNEFSLIGNPRWSEINADYYFEEPPSSITVSKGGSETRKVLAVVSAYPGQLFNLLASGEDKALLSSAHATYTPSNAPYALSWFALASLLPDFPTVLQKRLAKNPEEIISLRFEQDLNDGKQKKEVCERQEKLYRSNPDNPDFYYLHCRCMEDGIDQDNAFIEGRNKWMDNPWLAFASSRIFVERENWDEAIACQKLVNEKSPELREAIWEELKRACLYTHQEMPDILEIQPPYMMYLERTENSKENNTPDDPNNLYAYKLLEQGKIDEAIEFSKADTNVYFNIVRLAAVSDGASPKVKEIALALYPTQEFNATNYAATLALRIKNNLSTEEYKDVLKAQIGVETDTVFSFVQHLQAKRISEADRIIQSVSAELKGKLSLLGILVLEDKSPPRWYKLASGLLFITEKPYLTKLAKSKGA